MPFADPLWEIALFHVSVTFRFRFLACFPLKTAELRWRNAGIFAKHVRTFVADFLLPGRHPPQKRFYSYLYVCLPSSGSVFGRFLVVFQRKVPPTTIVASARRHLAPGARRAHSKFFLWCTPTALQTIGCCNVTSYDFSAKTLFLVLLHSCIRRSTYFTGTLHVFHLTNSVLEQSSTTSPVLTSYTC